MRRLTGLLAPRVALGVLAVVALLAYARNLDDYFIGDDFDLIGSFEGQPPAYFLRVLAANESGDAWLSLGFRAHGGQGYLRPLKIWLLKLDSMLWGVNPFGFHLTAAALFAALPPIVFMILERLEVHRAVAFSAAFALAVHPVFGAIVPFITAQEETLAALSSVGAWLLFLRARLQSRSTAPVVALYAMAVLSKESAVPTLALPLLWDVLTGGREPKGRSAWAVHAALGLLLAAYLGLRFAAFGNVVGGDVGTSSFRSLDSFLDYHRRFWASLFSGQCLAGATHPVLRWSAGLAGAAILAAGLALRRGDAPWLRRMLFFGPIWYLVTTSMLYGVYFDVRHHALPLVGLAISLGLAFDATLSTLRSEWHAPLAGLAVAAAALAFLPPSLRASREWERASEVTRRVRAETERLTRRIPDGGAVLLVDTPQDDEPPYWFGWGLQAALRRPFTSSDLSRRLQIVDWKNRRMNRDESELPEHFDMRIYFSTARLGAIERIWRRAPEADRGQPATR